MNRFRAHWVPSLVLVTTACVAPNGVMQEAEAPLGAQGEAKATATIPPDCLSDPRSRAVLDPDAKRDFNRADAAYRVGTDLVRDGDHRGALEAFQRAVDTDQMHGLAQLALAEAHLFTDNDQAEMFRHLAAAVLLLPDNPRAHQKYAELGADAGDRDLAIRHWRCAVALKPGLAEAHYGLARQYLARGQTTLAEEQIRIALATDEKNVQYRVLLADVLEAKGESLDAARAVESAAEIVERSAALYRRAGALYAAAGDETAAGRLRRVADKIDPPKKDRTLRPLRKARKKRKRKSSK